MRLKIIVIGLRLLVRDKLTSGTNLGFVEGLVPSANAVSKDYISLWAA